jgi:hypothetical protein
VIEVGVDGCSQLGLIAFIIELEHFAFVITCLLAGRKVAISLVALVDHLYFVVQQPHRLYCLPQLERLVDLVGFIGHVGHKLLDVGLVIQLQNACI